MVTYMHDLSFLRLSMQQIVLTSIRRPQPAKAETMAEVSPYWTRTSGGSAAQSNLSVDQDSGRERVKLLESLPEHANSSTPTNARGEPTSNPLSISNEQREEEEEFSVFSHVYMSVYRQGGDSQRYDIISTYKYLSANEGTVVNMVSRTMTPIPTLFTSVSCTIWMGEL